MKEERTESFYHSRGVTEFALLYFPDQTPKTAYTRLNRWIHDCRGLRDKLLATGWTPGRKLFTPLQVRCLIDHLGEP